MSNFQNQLYNTWKIEKTRENSVFFNFFTFYRGYPMKVEKCIF